MIYCLSSLGVTLGQTVREPGMSEVTEGLKCDTVNRDAMVTEPSTSLSVWKRCAKLLADTDLQMTNHIITFSCAVNFCF